MKYRRLALLLAPTLLLAWAGWLLIQRDRTLPVTDDSLPTYVERQSGPALTPASMEPAALTAVSLHTEIPLPAWDLPFHEAVSELEERAANGDGAAGCLLASGHLHCHSLPLQRLEFDGWLKAQNTRLDIIQHLPPDRADTRLAEFEAELERLEGALASAEHHCGNLAPPSPADIANIWHRAARAGNRAAMKQYASGNAFRWDSLLEALPELATFRQEAPAMAWQLMHEGDVEMLALLATAHSPLPRQRRWLLDQAVTPDAVTALALHRQLQQTLTDEEHSDPLLEDTIRQLQAQLSPEQLQQAERLRADHFSGWVPRHPAQQGLRALRNGVRDISANQCEEPETGAR